MQKKNASSRCHHVSARNSARIHKHGHPIDVRIFLYPTQEALGVGLHFFLKFYLNLSELCCYGFCGKQGTRYGPLLDHQLSESCVKTRFLYDSVAAYFSPNPSKFLITYRMHGGPHVMNFPTLSCCVNLLIIETCLLLGEMPLPAQGIPMVRCILGRPPPPAMQLSELRNMMQTVPIWS